jgi:hypothetical protein
VNSGTGTAAIFDFTIPQGATGATGATGASGSVRYTRMNHVTATNTAGVATTMTLANSGYGLTAGFNGPGVPALNDAFINNFQLDPGTYTMMVVGSRLGNRGLTTFSIDGVGVGAMDWYLNGTDSIYQKLTVTISATVNNLHTITAIVTKNAASTGYYVYLGEFFFY